jgi:hypothetical protein
MRGKGAVAGHGGKDVLSIVIYAEPGGSVLFTKMQKIVYPENRPLVSEINLLGYCGCSLAFFSIFQ